MFPQIEGEIKKGDVVRGGVVIQNSEIGMSSYSANPFVERLVCLNGMIVPEYGQRKSHAGRLIENTGEYNVTTLYQNDTLEADDKALMLKMRDIITGAASDELFHKIVGKMRETTERKITGNPVKAVEVLGNRIGLNDTETTDVLTSLIHGHDLTQYGLLNAVTDASKSAEDYDRATQMESLGGAVLTLPESDWKEIAEAA